MNKEIASRKVFVVLGIVWTIASKDFAIVVPRLKNFYFQSPALMRLLWM